MAEVLLAGAAVAAVGDWIAVWRRTRVAEYLFKPLTLLFLIAAAVALHGQAPPLRWIFTVAALSFSLIGDTLLMLPGDLFVGGLRAFLVGHIAYVTSLSVGGPPPAAVVLGAIAVAGVAVPIYLRLRRGMVQKGAGRMAVPVALYVVAIGAMVAAALATLGDPEWSTPRSALAVAGASLFMTSDGLIGWNRFVRPLPWAPVAIMITYHLAQGALLWALLGWTAPPV